MNRYMKKSGLFFSALAFALALIPAASNAQQSLPVSDSDSADKPAAVYPALRFASGTKYSQADIVSDNSAQLSFDAADLSAADKASEFKTKLPKSENNFEKWDELFLFQGTASPIEKDSPFYSPAAAVLDKNTDRLYPEAPWDKIKKQKPVLFSRKTAAEPDDSLNLEPFKGYFGSFYTPQKPAEDLLSLNGEAETEAADKTNSAENGIPVHLAADKISADEDTITAQGNASIDLMGARLLCEYLVLDKTTGKLTASENCVIYWNGNIIAAEWITYDPNNKIAVMHNVSGKGADFYSQKSEIDGSLFFWAETMQWTQEKISLTNSAFTTCDKAADNLDYKFVSDYTEIYPQDRLIASNTGVYLKDKRLYTLPTLNMALDNKKRGSSTIIPSIGKSSTDGWYMRSSADYVFDNKNYGTIYLDYYTKTGLGAGIQQYYSINGDKGHGDFYYYRLNGGNRKNNADLNSNIYYSFDDENKVSWEFSSNKSQENRISQANKINSQFDFRHKDEANDLRLSHNYNTIGKDNRNTTWRMYYDLQINPDLATTWKAELSTISTRSRTAQRFYYYGSLRHSSELFDTELMMENTTGDTNYTLNRSPEFTLRSQPMFVGDVPMFASASFGHVTESPSMFSTNRYDIKLQIPDQVIEYGSGRFLAGAGFRQLFYGTGESMYSLAARLGWMQELGDSGTIRIDYNWYNPRGETPIQYDYMIGYENLTGGIEFFQDDVFNLAVTSGYNLKTSTFQNVTPRIQVRPDKNWLIGAGCAYDPNTSSWRNLDTNFKFQITDELSLCHWSVYDLKNSRFTYQDYQVDYESHDWITSLVYRSVQNEFYFQFSLKAFPQPPVTIGPNDSHNLVPKNRRNAFVHY